MKLPKGGVSLTTSPEHNDAAIYGGGDKKLGEIVIDDAKAAGKPIPKGSLSKLGSEVRQRLSEGLTGYGELVKKAQRAHAKVGALPGLDGRWIPSNSDHSALNTLLQGNGAIIMKKAQCLFDDEITRRGLDVEYCASVHDEVDVTCPVEIAEQVVEIGKWAITEAGIQLGVRCPLVGDGKIGANWYEVH